MTIGLRTILVVNSEKNENLLVVNSGKNDN